MARDAFRRCPLKDPAWRWGLIARLACAIALIALVPAPTEARETGAPARIAIKAARVIDGLREEPLATAVIVIENGRISTITPGGSVPAGAELIDLGQRTVLPGFIDAHTHLTGTPEHHGDVWAVRLSSAALAFESVPNARATLEAGFTTVRDIGAANFVDVALRDAINTGKIAGPRMQVAGQPISSTGGHADLNSLSPDIRFIFSVPMAIADGEDEIRKTVRTQIKYGVDWIKIMASGGVLSHGDTPGAQTYTEAELRAAVDEAHLAGRPVAAHSHGAGGMKAAIRAGVRSIEHCSLADDEAIKLAAERGVYFVMDIYNDDFILARGKELGWPEEFLEKERKIGKVQRETFTRALRGGVKLVFGTDSSVYPHGDNGRQFSYMAKYGMSPLQAIKAATSVAADLLGWGDRVGRIAPGYFADLIAVDADPLADVRSLERVSFVMKEGKVVKAPGGHPAVPTSAGSR